MSREARDKAHYGHPAHEIPVGPHHRDDAGPSPADALGQRVGGALGMRPCFGCIDCIMAWLLFGDGAVCLAGHGRIYWVGKRRSETNA